MEDQLFTVENNRVAGVGAALVAGDDVGVGAQVVDYLALAFVAPLSADYYFYGHDTRSHVFR